MLPALVLTHLKKKLNCSTSCSHNTRINHMARHCDSGAAPLARCYTVSPTQFAATNNVRRDSEWAEGRLNNYLSTVSLVCNQRHRNLHQQSITRHIVWNMYDMLFRPSGNSPHSLRGMKHQIWAHTWCISVPRVPKHFWSEHRVVKSTTTNDVNRNKRFSRKGLQVTKASLLKSFWCTVIHSTSNSTQHAEELYDWDWFRTDRGHAALINRRTWWCTDPSPDVAFKCNMKAGYELWSSLCSGNVQKPEKPPCLKLLIFNPVRSCVKYVRNVCISCRTLTNLMKLCCLWYLEKSAFCFLSRWLKTSFVYLRKRKNELLISGSTNLLCFRKILQLVFFVFNKYGNRT